MEMDMKKFNELSLEEQKKEALKHSVEAMRTAAEQGAATAKIAFDTEEEMAAHRAQLEEVFSDAWDRVINMTEDEFCIFMFGKIIGADDDKLNKIMEALK